MDKETLKKIRTKTRESQADVSLLENMKKLLDGNDDTVEVRLRGLKIRIPTKLVEEAVLKAIKVQEKKVVASEHELRTAIANG